MRTAQYLKAPVALLDWGFDWNSKKNGELPWLSSGETITSHQIIADTGITVNRSTAEEGFIKVWLSGGELGKTYRISCKINTDAGRVDIRTILIKVQDR